MQRVALEVVQAVDKLLAEGTYPGLQARLLVPPDADLTRIDLRRIAVETVGTTRGHRWEQSSLPAQVGTSVLLCLGNTAPVVSLLRKHPVAVMLHDLAYRTFPDDYSRAYRIGHRVVDSLILRRATPLFTVSHAERASITAVDSYAGARIVVAPNGGWSGDDPPEIARKPLLGPQAFGMHVGTLSTRKNAGGVLDTAIEMARLRRMRFLFVGPSGSVAADLGRRIPADIRSLIAFRGYVDDRTLSELYASATYLLFPTFYEASGLPPTEAMTFGCPIVTSDIAVLRERCGDAAQYCDPHDRASILKAVLDVVDHPQRGEALARAGRERAKLFTWSAQARIIVDAILDSSSARVRPAA